jgi:hypothetical protein
MLFNKCIDKIIQLHLNCFIFYTERMLLKKISISLCLVLPSLLGSSQIVDPYKFIATLRFADCYHDYFKTKQERMFPVAFSFNITQDGNADGKINVEDSIYGTSRTGLTQRGPNNQHPTLYFHLAKCAEYTVYEYWLYYADNDYLNDHEHDWEKYFVYVKDTTPCYVFLGHHKKFNSYNWNELPKDNDHAILGVNGGSHAMENKNQIGVEIRYNDAVSKHAGRLAVGDGKNLSWRIFSNDSNVIEAIPYVQQPDCFFNGDPLYGNIIELSSSKELDKCSKAPWLRLEWDNPPKP